jgi:hypothetical protein
MQRVWVGAQDIGNQKRVTLIGVGICLAIAPTSALDRAGWNDKHLPIALIPQNVDQDGMSGFQSDLALRACHPQLLARSLQLRQGISGVRYGDAAQDLAARIQETGIVVGVTPINATKDLHSASFRKCEAEALSADAVSVFLLEPSRGRPLWTVTPGQAGETVRRERSKRSCKQVISPQLESRQARPTR